ncbi:MAG TPA: hypothetical protein VLJ68_04200 [Chitinophagaceae bacterium]|nr:hypothetical protein [Chitinophagaceae bacterium]
MKEVASTIQTLIDTHTISMMKIPAVEISQKPGPGRWSKKEIIGHMPIGG